MEHFAAFSDAWYADIVERYGGNDNHNRAIVAAACIIAESIDQAFNKSLRFEGFVGSGNKEA